MSLAMISPTLSDVLPKIEDPIHPTPKPVLQLVDVRKIFGDFAAVDGISVDIREGEFVTIAPTEGRTGATEGTVRAAFLLQARIVRGGRGQSKYL